MHATPHLAGCQTPEQRGGGCSNTRGASPWSGKSDLLRSTQETPDTRAVATGTLAVPCLLAHSPLPFCHDEGRQESHETHFFERLTNPGSLGMLLGSRLSRHVQGGGGEAKPKGQAWLETLQSSHLGSRPGNTEQVPSWSQTRSSHLYSGQIMILQASLHSDANKDFSRACHITNGEFELPG